MVYDNPFTTIDSETQVDNISVPKGFNELMKNLTENIVDVNYIEGRTNRNARTPSYEGLESEGGVHVENETIQIGDIKYEQVVPVPVPENTNS